MQLSDRDPEQLGPATRRAGGDLYLGRNLVTRNFDVASAVDDLRQLVAKADALAHAVEDLFERLIWIRDDDAPRRVERLAHLVGSTAAAVEAAAQASDQLAADLAKSRRGG